MSVVCSAHASCDRGIRGEIALSSKDEQLARQIFPWMPRSAASKAFAFVRDGSHRRDELGLGRRRVVPTRNK
jgi:hypothetical protein